MAPDEATTNGEKVSQENAHKVCPSCGAGGWAQRTMEERVGERCDDPWHEIGAHHRDCVNSDDDHIRCLTGDGEYVERGPGLRPRCAGRMEAAHALTYMVDGECPVCGEVCSHPSLNGIDQSDGPDKVWECAGCGLYFRFEYAGNGSMRLVQVTFSGRSS